MKTFEQAYSDYEKCVHLAQEADKVYKPLRGKWENGEWVQNPMEEWITQKKEAEGLWEVVHNILLHIFYLDNKNILDLLEKHKKNEDFNHLLIAVENVRRHMGSSAFSDIYIEVEEDRDEYGAFEYIRAAFTTKLFEMALDLWETQLENHKEQVVVFVSQVYDILLHHRWEKTPTTLDLYTKLSCTILDEKYEQRFYEYEDMSVLWYWINMTHRSLRESPTHFFTLWERAKHFLKEPFTRSYVEDWWTKTHEYVMSLPTQEN